MNIFLIVLLYLILFIVGLQCFIYLLLLILSIIKYFFVSEKNILNRYGTNSWVVITGGSSGQGKQFCLEFAKRGFNILIIGSKRILDVEKEINNRYPKIKTKIIIKNFSKAYQKNFFDSIKYEIEKISNNVSILSSSHISNSPP